MTPSEVLATSDYEIHPLADIFPMLPEDRFVQLIDSIQKEGLGRPVILDGNGVVIDGRNRLAACIAADIEPRTITHRFQSEEDVARFIERENIHRRDLTPGERAMMMQKLLNARRSELETAGRERGETDLTLEAAERAGVGRTTMAMASTIAREAPELADKVAAGETSIRSAYRAVKGRSDENKGLTDEQSSRVNSNSTQSTNSSPESKAPKEAPTDAIGNELGPVLAASFAGAKQLAKEIADAADALAERIEDAADGGVISTKIAAHHLRETRKKIRHGLPYAICPLCGGKGCDTCKNRGWLPKSEYRSIEGRVS